MSKEISFVPDSNTIKMLVIVEREIAYGLVVPGFIVSIDLVYDQLLS